MGDLAGVNGPMTTRYTGRCMCGAVRFSFAGSPRFVAECVCDSCRRAHGASSVCWVGVANQQFTLDDGESVLRWYQSSEASERGFCVSCGTRLFFRSSRWPGEVHMAVACIDPPHDLVATEVSYGAELPDWTAVTFRKH